MCVGHYYAGGGRTVEADELLHLIENIRKCVDWEIPVRLGPFILKSQFACRALAAELSASNVAAHGGQAAMPCVTHDLFVGNTIAVSRRNETGAQAVGAERFS